ncbi:MAG TPA: DUF3224 domain-containing protein [Polyangiaceae bacterium]|nr:DUF3224 domain-containing protein [Polyangiaceae bacterium]
MKVNGSFDVKMTAEPPFDAVEGITLGRARFDKRFTGPLDATSVVHMLSCLDAAKSSGAYSALERVTGSIGGKTGTFVLQHTGVMDAGRPSLVVTVVPGSGTGELIGLRGRMEIRIEQGAHFYELDFELA